MNYKKIKEFQGKIVKNIITDLSTIDFYFNDGTQYRMEHSQDCCESVVIDDICGDLNDLIGKKLVDAEVCTSGDDTCEYGCGMWTFYRLRTITDTVTIRWHGTSNGYYSVDVNIIEISSS